METKINNLTEQHEIDSLMNIILNKIKAQYNTNYSAFNNRFNLGKLFEYHLALTLKDKGYKVQFAPNGDTQKDLIVNDTKLIEVKFQILDKYRQLKFKYQTYSKKTRTYVEKGYTCGAGSIYWYHYFKDIDESYYYIWFTKEELTNLHKANSNLVCQYGMGSDYPFTALTLPLEFIKKHYPNRIHKLDI